jgi:hypothetical protein
MNNAANTAPRIVTFTQEGTAGYASTNNFGHNWCTDRNSGEWLVLVDGDHVATLTRYAKGEPWHYCGPVKDRDCDVERMIGNLRATKRFAREQLS